MSARVSSPRRPQGRLGACGVLAPTYTGKIINDELSLPTKWIKLSLLPLHFDTYALLIANKRQNVDKYCF
jgi:hypothetical protein